jgi:outer membrane protein OmpA-like peptidoglycan-associated protein
MRLPLALMLCLGPFALPATAQDLTDQELLQLFQTQRDAFKAARESGLGKTRGLTLVTVDTVAGTTAAGSVTTLEPAATTTGGETVAVTGETATATTETAATESSGAAVQPVVFGELAPELQVNVNIKFGFDSAALTPDQAPRLAQLCKVMKSSDIQLFRVVGHTDASGTEEYNQKLSQLRADEVKRYLVNDCGIAESRLEALGMGENFLADKDDPDAADNRRVEFQALS